MKNRVVITGVGVVSPNAIGVDNYETALRKGFSGIRFIPKLEELKFACRIAGIPENIDSIRQDYSKYREISYLSDSATYAVLAAIEAWENAGLILPDENDPPDWDTSAIIGSGVSDMQIIAEHIVPKVNEGKVRRIGTRIAEQAMSSAPSARVAGILGVGNQVTSNSSACSTGTEAIIEAALKIRMGATKRVVAGSTEGASPYTWAGFDSMRILSNKFNDQPEKGSRPMSASACGFVPGAGAGVLILENLETALARGGRIYAEILGVKVNCGGQRGGGSMTSPNPDGIQRCIQGAVHDAGITPDEIEAINGHLTATFADPHEVKNWSRALNRGPDDFPYINSTKSMIGHCLGAAGALEIVGVVLELYKGFIHPTINCEDIHSEIKPFEDRIPRTCVDYPELKTIAKASFGFGDVNSCLIIKKWNNR
jgi:3-oxoacyl-(acyl-carrier-protein) synthase